MSANALGKIPPSSESEESLSTLQELYLTGNNLTENCGALLVGHQNLRVLHIAYNQLLSFPARCVSKPPALIMNNLIFTVTHMLRLLQRPQVMSGCYFSKLSKLEQLEELNLSGNKLKTIPSTVSSCKRLHTLIAHSNHITVFPEILNLPEIKVRGFPGFICLTIGVCALPASAGLFLTFQLVDLSCNELTEIQLPDSLPATLQELDLTGNNSLTLEHKTLNLFRYINQDQLRILSSQKQHGILCRPSCLVLHLLYVFFLPFLATSPP